MIKNYFLIAIRNLKRNKLLSFINISGLSVGLACCMLIFLFTKDEISFDRFHTKKDQLYRLTCDIMEKDGTQTKYGLGAMVQGPAFKATIPEIREFNRVMDRDYTVKRGNETFTEKVVWTDDNFFSLFSFPITEGKANTALTQLNSMVLTEETAIKYFGTTNVIGKTLEFEINNVFEPFTVSAIAKKSPANSTIQFSIVLPFKYLEKTDLDNNWMWLSYPTYFLMNANTDLQAVAKKMDQVYRLQGEHDIADDLKHGGGNKFNWGVQPFLQMHLDTATNGTDNASDPMYSYILTGIALFILLIACINFVNLTVAQSLKRSKEIGIRKVVGGQRKQLIRQFLGESFLVCFIAFAFAILLAQVCLPVFNEMANKKLSLSYLLDAKLVVSFIILYIFTSLAAGFYPALVLSGFDPVKTLYHRSAFTGRNYLSKGLIVVQFALATFLIITTMFIYSQFNYLTHKQLGYNEKNLLVVNTGQGRDGKLMSLFKTEFTKVPGVLMVAPAMGGDWVTVTKANNKEFDVKYEHVDEDFLPLLQVPVLQGRNFSTDFPADSTTSVLVNEAYASAAGWANPVGQKVDFLNGNPVSLTIVGLVKDFHFETLKQKIKPQIFSVQPNLPFGKFYLRIDRANLPATIAAIEKIYRKLVPNRPFSYNFKDDLNYKAYEAEARWKEIITFAAIITIFISCIGLFGLTTLTVQKRAKEIGVRKVLGASVLQVSTLVSRNYITLVVLAFLLAIPAAWYTADRYLQNFAYRISISWWVFAIASILTTLIALTTVSLQAIKAAVANPVKSLRTE